jgi:beta-galactosidase
MLEGEADMLMQMENGNAFVRTDCDICYMGGWPDQTLWQRILIALCEERCIPHAVLPEGLRLRDTATHRFAFNYAPEPVTWNGVTIAPADCHWWPLESPTAL